MQRGQVHDLTTVALASVAKYGKGNAERSRGIHAQATSTTRTWFKLVFTHIYEQPRGS